MTRLHLVPVDGVAWVDLDGDVLAWTGEELVLLADQAGAVWRAVDGATTRAEVVAEVARAAGADPSVVGPDVRAFLGELVDRGLVREVPGTPGPRWSVPDDVAWVRDGDAVVVVRHGTGARDVLSPSASRIFELAWEGVGLAEVVDELGAEFADAPPDLGAVVEAALADLVARGYLRPAAVAP